MSEIVSLDQSLEDKIKEDLLRIVESKRERIYSKLMGAALGSVPWVGGFLSASKEFLDEESQIRTNQLYMQWFTEHKQKMAMLGETLISVVKRLDEMGEDVEERIQSEEYLQLVRKSFRTWDNADTHEKRELIRKLMTNAAAQKLIPDDLIRMFIEWINHYHEAHFSVIKIIYQSHGPTRHDIWRKLDGRDVRENSLEADLFKMLIRDLSMSNVIRQKREMDYDGHFYKKASPKSKTPSKLMESAFESSKSYELTELGKHFVHYTMTDVVSKIGSGENTQ